MAEIDEAAALGQLLAVAEGLQKELRAVRHRLRAAETRSARCIGGVEVPLCQCQHGEALHDSLTARGRIIEALPEAVGAAALSPALVETAEAMLDLSRERSSVCTRRTSRAS